MLASYRRRAAVRSGWLALAGLLQATCSSGPDPTPFAARNPIQRLGAPGGHAKLGGESRPVLSPAPGGRVIAALEEVPPSRVLLAVGVGSDASGPGAEEPRCRVVLETPRRARRLLAEFPATRAGWTEVELALAETVSGSLDFGCRGTRSARWARPLVLPEASPSNQPLIVLLSIDTLRADHVSGFGAPPELTPALARLGDEGLRLVNATSDATWTLPSHFSIFFSRLWSFEDPRSAPTSLAQQLAQAGFAAIGLTGGGFVGARWGLNLGFDSYRESRSDLEDLEPLLASARTWIERLRQAPTYLFLHTYAVHEQAPEQRRWIRERRLWTRSQRSARLLASWPRFDLPTEDEMERIREHYREQVAATDAKLAGFFDHLRGIAEQRPVLLIALSDHGEAQGEHGSLGHGSGRHTSLHDELVRVPIIVWSPGRVPAGRASRRPTMLIDVAPSLLAAAGVAAPPTMLGSDRWPLWSGRTRRGAEPEPSVSYLERRGWTVRQGGLKLIASRAEPSGRRRFELFAMEDDPGEQRNLAPWQPGRVEEMTELLRNRLLELEIGDGQSLPDCARCDMDDVLSADPELDPLLEEQLRELGYLP